MGLCTSKNEKTDIAETDNFSTAPVPAPPSGYRLPSDKTLQYAAKIAIEQDKPIMMDYWKASLNETCVIGVNDEKKEKFLVKHNEECTSPIAKIYKVNTEYIIIVDPKSCSKGFKGSIYLVDCNIPTSKIS
jgi:hypothetical protein